MTDEVDPSKEVVPATLPAKPVNVPVSREHTLDWRQIPIDAYWFSKAIGRSPQPGEKSVWNFELVTMDSKDQRGRMYARVDAPYEEALELARFKWEEDIAALKQPMFPRSIMVVAP